MNQLVTLTLAVAALAAVCTASYAPAKYEAPKPAYHAPAPSYHAPTAVKCGSNLLIGCAPSVAHVPCVPSHGGGHSYGGGHGGHGGHGGGYHRAAESEAFDQMD
ncbi:vitelline membrane protein 15a-1 [Sabethes cyaneus]|uniref:vitelline membrane protein 15a-1 n=1 Tax=Sabethes cyaneus TaxID=53552 RepID=UPI00237D4D45|nr:vitelline membrane protein 15a-1 [Sabethes cyaneus]